MPQSATAPRWNSDLDDAQLKFLSGFLRGAECPADDSSRWMDVLNVTPSMALALMVEVGLLAPAPLALKMERFFKATEVKAMLRERGLPVSGRKADCIARLITADQAGMEAKVFHVPVFVCTERGRIPAEAYLSQEAERQRRARQSSFELLCRGQLREARFVVAEYERGQVFWRGVGVDWSLPPSSECVSRLQSILGARPAILKDVGSGDWVALQRAAAMMELWGESDGRVWLPSGFVGASNLDLNTSVRMVFFAGRHLADLCQYRETGCSQVEISGCGEGSCPDCKRMNGRKYLVSQVPELPHPECTNDMGCRCMALPVFE